MKELNEMTIGRTDDPENPFRVSASEAAGLFGAGSRNPFGPAVMIPRQQAGHMIAIDPPVRILTSSLESKGPSTQDSYIVVKAIKGRQYQYRQRTYREGGPVGGRIRRIGVALTAGGF
jgi:hypothetical protein